MARAPGPKPFRILIESWSFVLARFWVLLRLAAPLALCAFALYWAQILTAPPVTLTDLELDAAWPAALRGHAALFALALLAPSILVGTGIMKAVFSGAVPGRPQLGFGAAERAVFLSQAKLLGAGAAYAAAIALPGILIAIIFFGLIRAEGLDLVAVNQEGGPLFGLMELSVVVLFAAAVAFFLLRGLLRQLVIAPHAAFTGRANLKESWEITEGFAWELFAVFALMGASHYAIVLLGFAPIYAFVPEGMRALLDILVGRVPELEPAGGLILPALAAALYAALVTFSSLIFWVMLAKTYQSVTLSSRMARALKGPADEPGEAVAAALEGTGFGKRTEPPVAPTPQP